MGDNLAKSDTHPGRDGTGAIEAALEIQPRLFMSVAREEDDLRTNCEPTLLFEAPLAGSSRGFDCLFCSAADAVGRSVAGQSLTRRKKSAAKHPNSHELLSSLSHLNTAHSFRSR